MVPREPKGAVGDWTDERGACDEPAREPKGAIPSGLTSEEPAANDRGGWEVRAPLPRAEGAVGDWTEE